RRCKARHRSESTPERPRLQAGRRGLHQQPAGRELSNKPLRPLMREVPAARARTDLRADEVLAAVAGCVPGSGPAGGAAPARCGGSTSSIPRATREYSAPINSGLLAAAAAPAKIETSGQLRSGTW